MKEPRQLHKKTNIKNMVLVGLREPKFDTRTRTNDLTTARCISVNAAVSLVQTHLVCKHKYGSCRWIYEILYVYRYSKIGIVYFIYGKSNVWP